MNIQDIIDSSSEQLQFDTSSIIKQLFNSCDYNSVGYYNWVINMTKNMKLMEIKRRYDNQANREKMV